MASKGTGFWLIVALMLILSVTTIFETAIRAIVRMVGFGSIASRRRRLREATLARR